MIARRFVNPTRLLMSAASWLWLVEVASAQVVVVAPNIYTDTEGPASNNALIRNQGQPRTLQIVYHAHQLTGLVGTQITGISYRLSNNLPGGYPQVTTTWSNYRISLGLAVAPADMTTTFATNFIAPPTLVRSGSFRAGPLAWPVTGEAGPAPWGPELTFSTPYPYTSGHLGLLITHPGSNNPDQGNTLLDAAGTTSPNHAIDQRAFIANAFNAATGTANDFTNVIRFTAVPGPLLAGDFNKNGVVDAADYVVWRQGLGTTHTQTDYDVWRAHYGTMSLGMGTGSGAVDLVSQWSASAEPAKAAYRSKQHLLCWQLQ